LIGVPEVSFQSSPGWKAAGDLSALDAACAMQAAGASTTAAKKSAASASLFVE
jgi:hypothetical protein